MADDAAMYRQRAEAERTIAAETPLAMVRDRALRSAERWDQLASQVDRTREHASANRPKVA
jgi:hypothetical protein